MRRFLTEAHGANADHGGAKSCERRPLTFPGVNFEALGDFVVRARIEFSGDRAGHSEFRLLGVEIAVVISNRANAPGLKLAQEMKLPAFCIPSKGMDRTTHDAEMLARLHQHRVDLVCLAGYMRVLTPEFVRAFPQRILNVHPSLLPAFPGLDAQKQALEAGVKVAGCTVHFVDEAVDHGVTIVQRPVPVLDEDTVELLSARILEQEHLAYTEALVRVLSGQYVVRGRRYVRI